MRHHSILKHTTGYVAKKSVC